MANTLWKRLAIGTLAITSALAIAGCSTNSTPPATSGPGTTAAPPATSTAGAPTSSSASNLTSSNTPLTVLFGTSGDAETKAMQDAAAAFSASSGVQVTATPATDMNQQMAQGFSSGKPADVFYLDPGMLRQYADAGNLLAYGNLLDSSVFYPSLLPAYTYKGQLYGAPKDFSTLALVINTDLWAAAGLTAADYPTSWDQLHADALKLTKGNVVGMITGGEYARLGALMVANGSNLMNPDQTKVTATDQSNIDALTFVQTMLKDGSWKFASTAGFGWGGEAFGKAGCAMTIEGNWILGALNSDYKNIKWAAVPLPTAPSGKQGTLMFSNGWGIAAKSPNQKAAVDFVKFLTTPDQQMKFAQAFGIMPSVKSTQSTWSTAFPNLKAFADSAAFAQSTPTVKGAGLAINDLNSQIPNLASTDAAKSDPKAILQVAQNDLSGLL